MWYKHPPVQHSLTRLSHPLLTWILPVPCKGICTSVFSASPPREQLLFLQQRHPLITIFCFLSDTISDTIPAWMNCSKGFASVFLSSFTVPPFLAPISPIWDGSFFGFRDRSNAIKQGNAKATLQQPPRCSLGLVLSCSSLLLHSLYSALFADGAVAWSDWKRFNLWKMHGYTFHLIEEKPMWTFQHWKLGLFDSCGNQCKYRRVIKGRIWQLHWSFFRMFLLCLSGKGNFLSPGSWEHNKSSLDEKQ